MSEQEERVSIRAHYERFPATVKGAFVLRGSDRDPHLVSGPAPGVAAQPVARRHEEAHDPPRRQTHRRHQPLFVVAALAEGGADAELDRPTAFTFREYPDHRSTPIPARPARAVRPRLVMGYGGVVTVGCERDHGRPSGAAWLAACAGSRSGVQAEAPAT